MDGLRGAHGEADAPREPGNPGETGAQAPRRNAAARPAQRAGTPAGDTAPVPAPGVRFEDAFARLEALVGEMERGELALEEMLARFEEGVALVRHCNSYLKQAQTRVEQYVEQKDGHWVLKDLE